MADIDIERKTSHGLLWAVLGVAALGLLLFWLIRGSDSDQVAVVDEPAMETPATAPPPPVTQPTTTPATAATQQYQQACAQPQTGTSSPDAQYTANCINLLATALEGSASASQVATVQPQLASARTAANQLGTTQDANDQAEYTEDAFESLSSAFESIAGTSSATEVQQLNEAASAISPEQPLSAQSQAVHTFFSEAGTLLTRVQSMGV